MRGSMDAGRDSWLYGAAFHHYEIVIPTERRNLLFAGDKSRCLRSD